MTNVNGNPDIRAYRTWIQGPSGDEEAKEVRRKGETLPSIELTFRVTASDKSGNSLLADDAPNQTFAEIVRIPKGGEGEVTDVAVTQMIQISSGD